MSGLVFSILVLALIATPARATHLMQVSDTVTPTATLTDAPPTATPVTPIATDVIPPTPITLPTTVITSTVTATVLPVNRPLLLAGYSLPKKGATVDNDFVLKLQLNNQGSSDAYNVIITMQGENLIPRGNGGIQALGQISAGQSSDISQTLYVSKALAGQTNATLNITVAYSDVQGASYSTTLVILVNLADVAATSGINGPLAATRTPTPSPRSKLLIGSFQTDLEKLQAGNLFNLTIDIQNLGNMTARSVTMILGGATISADGTPTSGGISGGSGDLSKFAPMGSSNLYFLGDITSGKTVNQKIPLVVNVTTEPGVYTFKISFVYEDGSGSKLLDDQVITLLVYGLPRVSVSFYQDVPDFSVGEFRTLPIQITNIGKKPIILGDLTISASSGVMGKNKATVGTIDTGGYFTLDAEYTADTPGPVTLTIQINYTDDFQQPGVLENMITFNVIDAPPPLAPDNGNGGDVPLPVEDSLWDRVLKAVLGFFGFSGG